MNNILSTGLTQLNGLKTVTTNITLSDLLVPGDNYFIYIFVTTVVVRIDIIVSLKMYSSSPSPNQNTVL